MIHQHRKTLLDLVDTATSVHINFIYIHESVLQKCRRSLSLADVKVMFIFKIFPVGSGDFTIITPRLLELTFAQSHQPRENAAYFLQLQQFTHYQFPTTWYPLMLGRQRWCGFKACQRLLHMTTAEFEAQTSSSWLQRLK